MKKSALVTSIIAASIVSLASSQAAVIATWDLNSDATDSVGGYNGVVDGSVTFGVDGAKGYSQTAAQFTGSNPSNIDVPFTSALNPAGDWTLMAWIKPDTVSGAHRSIITSRRDQSGNTSGYILYQFGTSLQFWSGNGVGGGWDPIVHSNVLVPGQWTHVALQYDADGGGATGRKTLFVNSQEVASLNIDIAPNIDRVFHIGSGADDGNSFFFDGAIDDVQFHDQLIPGAIMARMTATPLPEPSTVGFIAVGVALLSFKRRQIFGKLLK
jgi:hypothetical protein